MVTETENEKKVTQASKIIMWYLLQEEYVSCMVIRICDLALTPYWLNNTMMLSVD